MAIFTKVPGGASSGGGIVPPAGDIGGTVTSPTVTGLRGVALSGTAATNGEAYVLSGGIWVPTSVLTTLTGDVTTVGDVATVVGLDNILISGIPSLHQVLQYNGTNYVPVTIAAGDATVIAAGNLGATPTINLNAEPVTQVTGTLSANCAMTISGLTAGCSAILFITQGATPYTLTINGVSVAVPSTAAEVFSIQVWSTDGATLYILPPATTTALPIIDFFNPANPASTVSTAQVMAGLGSTITFTPASTGKVLARISGLGETATAVSGYQIQGRYGTGVAPANGAAATGTAFAQGILTLRPAVANGNITWEAVGGITGLTVGTAYWFDVAYDTLTAADALSISNIVATVQECT